MVQDKEPDSESPASKRQRTETEKRTDAGNRSIENAPDDELQLVESLLDEETEDFLSKEEREEVEAARRRMQRRQRLRQLEQSNAYNGKSDESNGQNGGSDIQILNKRNTDEPIKLDPLQQQQFGRVGEQQTPPKPSFESATTQANERVDSDGDEFDMFSSSVSPPTVANHTSNTNAQHQQQTKVGHEQEDWDDAEGYYKAVIGETIEFDSIQSSVTDDNSLPPSSIGNTTGGGAVRFRVAGVIGKGVFSSVLKCTTVSNSTSIEIPPTVALKCIRHNETMVKAAMNELRMLLRINGSPGIVRLLLPQSVRASTGMHHRGHVVMAFGYMEYNLRDVLQKFGKGVGLALQAVRSYFGQLLAAATHLQKHKIIHADLKPDNILVSADFGFVQLADFGSAIDVVSGQDQNQPTPYMVSRFYRAPEIILGLLPTFAIDLWSLAVTVAELYLGDVLFRGKSNNDMLFVFMQHLGPFSNRVIRQHIVVCQKLPIPCHFQQEGTNYYFKQETVDKVTGEPIRNILSLLPQNNENRFPSATPLGPKLIKAKSANDAKSMVLQFSDLLQKCLALDPTKRIAVKDAIRHDFFQSDVNSIKA